MNTYKLHYNLRFNTQTRFENVHFEVELMESEIDSLCFLFSKYFDQDEHVAIKGLTFFTEFNKCISAIKAKFEAQSLSQMENMHSIKNIFSIFLRDEFMKQVPHFRTIMQYLKKFYKPIATPDVALVMCDDTCKPTHTIKCFQCKCKYLSYSLSVLDVGLQEGWDIFLRPMFGMPLMLYVLLKTNYTQENNDIVNENNLITQIFIQFFYNLLSDKAYSMYTKHNMCAPFIKACQNVITNNVRCVDHERVLLMLNAQCNGNSSVNGERLLTPFKIFMMEMGKQTKMNKVNKIASTVLIGFYLRFYLEALYLIKKNKPLYPVAELEWRNVCRLILNKYTDENIDVLIEKLKLIKLDICNALLNELIVPESFIRHIITKYQLDNEIALLMELNHDCFHK
jgi:hypothetical protein